MPDHSSPLRRRRLPEASADIPVVSGGTRSVLAICLLLSGATTAIFTAGRSPQGNLGLFLLCAGAVLTICPPAARMNRFVAGAALAFLLCSAGSLLPAHLFHSPIWRAALARVPEMPLSPTVSAAPTRTLFWLAVLSISVLTGFFTMLQPLRSQGLLVAGLLTAGMCGTYSALSIFARTFGWIAPFSSGASFGFLPNRNHTATLLVIGSLLSVGILLVMFRSRRWLLVDFAVTTLVLCVTGLFFFSASRAGIVFLVLGLVAWVAGLGSRHWNRPLSWVLLCATILSGSVFLCVKSDARDRLFWPTTNTSTSKASVTDGSSRDRLRIYSDTLGIVRDLPLTGTGLGTFSLVFPFYRRELANENLVLHPESDWLMVVAETGLPATLCLAVLVCLLFYVWKPQRAHPYWPLRWAFLVAAGAGALHGMIDVPLHRAALGWLILLLAGIALQPVFQPKVASPQQLGRSLGTRAIFITGGLLALVLGGKLVIAEWFHGTALPPYQEVSVQSNILRTYEHGNTEAAMEQARSALKTFPLAPSLYYQFGVLALRYEDTDAEVDRAFLVQRLLVPFPAEVPHSQGMAWMSVDPDRATVLFKEAEDRQERLYPGSRVNNDYWRDLVRETTTSASVQQQLWDASVTRGPGFVLAWLEGVSKEAAQPRLPVLAGDPVFLDHLSSGDRRRYLSVWQSKGDPATLQNFVQAQAHDWKEAAELRAHP